MNTEIKRILCTKQMLESLSVDYFCLVDYILLYINKYNYSDDKLEMIDRFFDLLSQSHIDAEKMFNIFSYTYDRIIILKNIKTYKVNKRILRKINDELGDVVHLLHFANSLKANFDNYKNIITIILEKDDNVIQNKNT